MEEMALGTKASSDLQVVAFVVGLSLVRSAG